MVSYFPLLFDHNPILTWFRVLSENMARRALHCTVVYHSVRLTEGFEGVVMMAHRHRNSTLTSEPKSLATCQTTTALNNHVASHHPLKVVAYRTYSIRIPGTTRPQSTPSSGGYSSVKFPIITVKTWNHVRKFCVIFQKNSRGEQGRLKSWQRHNV